ncbi:hypothetical protein RhiirA4_480855 [Rhizophagus irregularis]|uniref:Uncharacterized protein n=1 Tax=Rhizophagus irregularis TaxID=588596 RepID=A0A2I1HIJ2_9GLOM|nr:hypothetical protein RhiirA4_480855 [Rhizophagus irregularis]
MATLWQNRKPCEFLVQWVLVHLKLSKQKAQSKPKTKKTPDKKKSGKTGNVPVSNQSKKKDKQQSSTKASKNNNELKKKSPKNGGGGNKDNKEVLAKILSLLRKLM